MSHQVPDKTSVNAEPAVTSIVEDVPWKLMTGLYANTT
jgi:hypothetical protein